MTVKRDLEAGLGAPKPGVADLVTLTETVDAVLVEFVPEPQVRERVPRT